jgi:hypothetical protein
MKDFKSTHSLPFEVANWPLALDKNDYKVFRIGTCGGLWKANPTNYEILAVDNKKKHNGHLQDVFDWFENSCKRDKKNLYISEFFNLRFKEYLIRERGFKEFENGVIKYFN